jgi:hypothetical protein
VYPPALCEADNDVVRTPAVETDGAKISFVGAVKPVITAALDGATESIPNPIDATATSATRLKVVFVDICFLSISQDQEFPELGFG